MTKSIVFPAIIFLGWRLYILLFQIFIQPLYLVTSSSDTLLKRLFLSWTTYWDAAHYLSIASKGYQFPQQAFFPLWPLLIKLGILIHIPGELTSYILTFILGMSNFILFYLLAKKLMDEKRAKLSLIFFASYPAAIFLHASYSENIFLFCTLLSFLLLENRKYFLSSLIGGFATASRIAGGALVVSFLFIKSNLKDKLILITIGSLGIFFYMFFLYINYGDFLYFIKGQLQWCQNAGRCGFVFPLSPLIDYGKLIFSGKENINLLSIRFNDWLSSMIFLALLPLIWHTLPKRYFVYSAIVLLMPLSSGTTTSMIRVVLTIFPAFFVLPEVLKSKYINIILWLLFIGMQLRFVALFTSFMWVA
jgi:hypothetical protein